LFFVLRAAADKFDYLAQGISLALVYIGVKLLLTFWNIHLPDWLGFTVILTCIIGSMLLSVIANRSNKNDGMPDAPNS
jgi:tellurite resistance protein TerC